MILRNVIKFASIALIAILISLATTYLILKHNITNKISQLDKTSRLIAGQVSSANLNSILGFTNDYFIFIIHRRDGRLLFESAKRPNGEKAVWEANKFIVFNTMLQNPEGVLHYPEAEDWQILSPRKIVQFVALAELDWVVGVELPVHVTWDQIQEVYSPAVLAGILFASLFLTFIFSLGGRRQKKIEEEKETSFPEPKHTPLLPTNLAEENLYKKRLIAEARRQLDSPSATPPMDVEIKKEPVALASAPIPPVVEEKRELPRPEVDIEKSPEPFTLPESDIPREEMETKEINQPAEKSPTEIYFNTLLDNKKGKPKPDTIIGMALSKKMNREKLDK